ncbi:MAG: LysM domain [Verrucomicrobiota bacterium]
MKLMLKFPALPRLKMRKRKKLRATATRRPLRIAATADYDEMAEPNMKLSRALLIVLLLHVVAVSGIIAFNAIKTRQVPTLARPKTVSASSNSALASTMTSNTSGAQPVTGQKDNGRSASKPAGKEEHKTEHGKATIASRKDDPGKVYIVAKGDNPATIAKKFKVSYDELLALNHVDDPKKLKIGQKLLIPPKTTKTKKAE